MKVSIILCLAFLLFSSFLSATFYEITVGPDSVTYDYTTISEAIAFIDSLQNPIGDTFYIWVYPMYDNNGNPVVTTYNEFFHIPFCTLKLESVEGPEFTVINTSNTSSEGNTAINVRSDGGNGGGDDFLAEIIGFTVLRDDASGENRTNSAIEIYSRNTNIVNCRFEPGDSTSYYNVFENSIYCDFNGVKKRYFTVVCSSYFHSACLDEEYAIFMESSNYERVSYVSKIHNNNFIDCGRGSNIQDVEVLKYYNNNIIQNNSTTFSTIGLKLHQVIPCSFHQEIDCNLFENLDLGIDSNTITTAWSSWNTFIDNKTSADFSGSSATFCFNLSYDNFSNENVATIINQTPSLKMYSNTLVSRSSNSLAIDCIGQTGFDDDYVYNNIFWGYDDIISGFAGSLLIDYCYLNQITSYNGSNNQIDPNATIFADTPNDDYELYWNNSNDYSACINTGDPDSNQDGEDYIEDKDDRDPDNSRLDIGYSPYHFTDRDFKYYNDGWHWDSYPRLNRDMSGEEDIVPILESMNPQDYSGLWMDYVSPDVLVFNNFLWNPTTYDVKSTNLYKIKLAPEDPRELVVFGNQLTSNHIIMGTMNANTWYWIGYWLTENRNIYDALYDYWDDVSAVFAEDWAYSKQQRGIGGSAPPVWSPEGKTMEYGKGYIVKFGQSITNFHWSNGGSPAKAVKSSTPVNFSFEELPEYEPIDILGINIREDIIEIGVFENETCVGAVVVEEFPVQLLAYTGQEECDSLSFRVITSTRNQLDISNYCVFDKHTGNFQNQSIVPGSNEYSIVTLGEPASDTIPTRISLESNYPNPFNPKTTISFTSFGNQKLTLTIYNLKGQRIRELFNKTFNDGEHTYIWDSKDDNGLPVSSGVYLYKLESKDSSCIKKMLLMK